MTLTNPRFSQAQIEWLADWVAKYRKSVIDKDADYVATHLGNMIGSRQGTSFDLKAFCARAGVKA